MRSYGALSWRYLKQQRRRSLLTVIGIVLSVALISAIGTMGQAVKDNLISNTIYENGSFHFSYSSAKADLIGELRNNVLVDQVGTTVSGSQTELQDGYSANIKGLNADGFDLLPVHLQDGRFPKSPTEIVVEEWLLERLPNKPGLNGKVTLNDMDGKPSEYTIVGLLKNGKSSQIEKAAKVFTLVDDAALGALENKNLQLFVTLKPGVPISDQLAHFEQLGDNNFATNHRLLSLLGESYDGGLNKALLIIFGTLVGLVVLSTIAVIYNAFHIAVLERIRQFGLLRTLGATPRQIRNLVFREASVLSLIAIPLGLAVGWAGLWIAIWLMTQQGMHVLQMDSFRLTFHWRIMGLSVAVGLFAVFVAAWLPARKASTVSPVEAAKGAGSIVRESYRRKRIPSLLQLMGVEGRMASSNIRRNRAKFRITTFSIAVSITLFIVFHYFTQQALRMGVDTTENTKIAFEINAYMRAFDENGKVIPPEDRLTADQLKQIAAIDGVEAVYGNYDQFTTSAWMQPDQINQRFIESIPYDLNKLKWNGSERLSAIADMQIYDQARFKQADKYLIAGTADPERLAAEDSVLIVQTVKPFVQSSGKLEQMELSNLKVGDTLTLEMGERDGQKSMREVTVAGILSQSPFDAPYPTNSILVIGTKQTIAELYKVVPEQFYGLSTALNGVKISVKDGADTESIKDKLEAIVKTIPNGAQLIDIVSEQKEERQFALQMQIFVYSFLIIIGLIGSLNIINTVQTNLLLRRREIGLLQAVGMTLGQVRKMASTEGIWFGVIGGFWGVGLGAAISYFLYKQLNDIQGVPFIFPWGGALIACGCAFAVGLLSVQSPLRRMNNASLIDRLREE